MACLENFTSKTDCTAEAPAQPLARRRNTPNAFFTEPVSNEVDMSHIDAMLDSEMRFSKTETWSKLSPYMRTALLHTFADGYASTHNLNIAEIDALKDLLAASVSRGKLKRAKDVDYDQPNRVIRAIPALTFDETLRVYSLRNLDPARVSTLKSLTPKRTPTLKQSTHNST
jgi:hypothetical protein